MCNVGISIEKFNPEVLYSIYCTTSDTFEGNYHCHDFIEFSYVVSGNVNYKIDDKFYLIKEKPCFHLMLEFTITSTLPKVLIAILKNSMLDLEI
ncbi:AraC family ligand binding domain-containing protein [Clostridium butyricum]